MPNPARLSRLLAGPHRFRRIFLVAASLALGGALVTVPAASAQSTSTMPALNHVFLIMEENHGLTDVIGNPAAPNLNYLASTFGVSPCCSESNYVGLLGGDAASSDPSNPFNNVQSDDAYWKNSVDAPSLIS